MLEKHVSLITELDKADIALVEEALSDLLSEGLSLSDSIASLAEQCDVCQDDLGSSLVALWQKTDKLSEAHEALHEAVASRLRRGLGKARRGARKAKRGLGKVGRAAKRVARSKASNHLKRGISSYLGL